MLTQEAANLQVVVGPRVVALQARTQWTRRLATRATAVASRAAKEVVFTRELLKQNGFQVIGATIMLGDNRAMYQNVQAQHDYGRG